MYYNVSATKPDGHICFVKDVQGDVEVSQALKKIEGIASHLQEELTVTIAPRVHIFHISPKAKID